VFVLSERLVFIKLAEPGGALTAAAIHAGDFAYHLHGLDGKVRHVLFSSFSSFAPKASVLGATGGRPIPADGGTAQRTRALHDLCWQS